MVSFSNDSLLLAAFVLRVAGISSPEPNNETLRFHSFQCLSYVAPLIWSVRESSLCGSVNRELFARNGPD